MEIGAQGHGMSDIIDNYFSTLFKSSNPSEGDMHKVLECVEPKIDGNMNILLCSPFTAEEIKNKLFDMHLDKSPEPDGMSSFFYQKYWSVVGQVISASLAILNDGAPIDKWNETIVTLIPKLKNPMSFKDRPISLCNVGCKIISRAMTNRLRLIMPRVVSEYQSAFIPERLITDNVILGFETLHWIRSRKGGKKCYAVLKLDMSKAYDRVELRLLDRLMEKLGFSHLWTDKVIRCIRTVK